jgi:hypothetical protein
MKLYGQEAPDVGCSYTPKTRRMTVDIRMGEFWEFEDVPRSVFDALVATPTEDQEAYFREQIMGKFSGKRTDRKYLDDLAREARKQKRVPIGKQMDAALGTNSK